ncbi:MAG: type I site-specific deoxyribonuclease, partial [Candidatus Methanofastidiosa archaeon]|nr:type I site-specific deoxyribonuclease [Candidatus Methanofastidiosa archaeon]
IEKLFSLADYIEDTVDSKLEESKVLRQSILKKAFEGKLVPQDPNDEPAEILLEKIKMEKSNKGKTIQEKLVQ